MEPVVHLRDAVSLLGRFPALAGVTLDVERGEVVLLRGPNGAGKTTLLRVCAGLVAVTSGEAVVCGHDLRRSRAAVRRHVGLLGHHSFLYEDLTVADNLRFWARAGRADAADADAAADRLGVGGRLSDVAVARLSAGQRRRVALAVVAARKPDVWLLDEPHAGLDQDARGTLDALVTEAAAEGAAVLIASHELDRAGAVSVRHIALAGGMVVEDAVLAKAVLADAGSQTEAGTVQTEAGTVPAADDEAAVRVP